MIKNISPAYIPADIFSNFAYLECVRRQPALLCYAFIPIGGFFTLVAALNIIQNVIIYRFIRTEIRKEWWPIATFIYLFDTSFYLMNFSMMRQGFVICVFLGLWALIKDRRWLISLIVLFMCSLVHGSSKVLIPFAFIGFLPNFSGKKFALFFIFLLLLLWTNISFLEGFFNKLFALEDFEEYVRYQEEDAGDYNLGLGLVIQLIPLFVSLFYLFTNPDDKFQNKLLVLIALLSFVVTPFTRIVPGVGRVSLYFSIYSFAAIPIVYSSIKNINIRRILLMLYIVVESYDYWIFFSNPVFVKSYSTFHTIFNVL